MSDEEQNKTESTRTRGAQKESAKRELEQAPLMLRKASMILLVGALFPFFSGVKYAATAAEKVGPETIAFPWLVWVGLKVVVLLGGWVLHECALVRAGEKPKSILAGLGNAHQLAGLAVAGILWIGVLVYIFTGTGIYVTNGGGELKEVFNLGAIAEVMTLMLAMFSITHIFQYEHGGKFNPLVPLLMIGPGLAGLLNLLASFSLFKNPHVMLGVLGLIGSVVVAAGGGLAINTMRVSLKEAKEQGEVKKAAMREARRVERASKR